MTRGQSRRADPGMALVAVMGLIAVLFLAGTVMALAISSSLQTVDVTSRQDAIHYAAESAVARGAAVADSADACAAAGGSIDGQAFTVLCEPAISHTAPDSRQLLSVPAGTVVADSTPLTYPLTLPDKSRAVWTVLGWRALAGSPRISAWIDGIDGCNRNPQPFAASPAYTRCRLSDEGGADDSEEGQSQTSAILHIVVRGGSIDLSGFLVRVALRGTGSLVTVLGQSGVEVDEADVALPGHTVVLWNTVSP